MRLLNFQLCNKPKVLVMRRNNGLPHVAVESSWPQETYGCGRYAIIHMNLYFPDMSEG